MQQNLVCIIHMGWLFFVWGGVFLFGWGFCFVKVFCLLGSTPMSNLGKGICLRS